MSPPGSSLNRAHLCSPRVDWLGETAGDFPVAWPDPLFWLTHLGQPKKIPDLKYRGSPPLMWSKMFQVLLAIFWVIIFEECHSF